MSVSDQQAAPDILMLRPFVPAKNFEISLQFYTDLGFRTYPLADGLASVNLGPFAFLLQAFDVEGFAGNFMMQMLVKDVATWWTRIAGLELGAGHKDGGIDTVTDRRRRSRIAAGTHHHVGSRAA